MLVRAYIYVPVLQSEPLPSEWSTFPSKYVIAIMVITLRLHLCIYVILFLCAQWEGKNICKI